VDYRAREESVFSLVHAYRMYLEVATLTEQEECRARNLKNAKRVRGQLRELVPQCILGRLCVIASALSLTLWMRAASR